MTSELVVGIDVVIKGHCESRYVQRWVKDVEKEQRKLRRHRLKDRAPVCLGKVVVGVDLPPGRIGRPHVEYPP